MNDGREILFTRDELREIQECSSRSEYCDPSKLHLGVESIDVVGVSSINSVIFAKGNIHTGFEHIQRRHIRWTREPKWLESIDENGNSSNRLQNQGIIISDSIPILNCCTIADSVYCKENLNQERNKRPELFEMFIGTHIHRDGTSCRYNLLLYKDSKVAHTLYPASNKRNPKKVKGFNFYRGGISHEYDVGTGVKHIEIPYLNHEKVVVYILVLRTYYKHNLKKTIVQINDKAGNPRISVFVNEHDIDADNEPSGFAHLDTIGLQHADLREYERIIRNIEGELGDN